MKYRLFICTIFMLSTTQSFAQNLKLTLQIDGFSNDKGKVMIAVYDSKDSFLEKHIQTANHALSNKKSTVTLSLPKGTYAIAIFHDENNNGKMDKNALGIPTEKYGFSNNARGFMSAPSFDKAKFTLHETKSISITVR